MNFKGLARTTALATVLGAILAMPTTALSAGDNERVVSFDYGTLDTLDALGLGDRIVAVPKQTLPDYLARYASDKYADAGGLKDPAVDALREINPTLILITGRQGEQKADLEKIAPVVEIALEDESYLAAVESNVLQLAERFDAADAAREKLAELTGYVEQQRDGISGDPEVLVVTHNDGNFTLRMEPVVYDVLDLDEPTLPEGVVSETRGTRTFTRLTPVVIAKMAPDALLIVDRSAAIGAGEIDLEALNQSLAEQGQADIRVTVLSPELWYLSGGGLQSVRLQIGKVIEAL